MNTDTPSPSGETAARPGAETPLTPDIPWTDSLPVQPPLHDRDPATEPQALPIPNDSSPSPLPEPQAQDSPPYPSPSEIPALPATSGDITPSRSPSPAATAQQEEPPPGDDPGPGPYLSAAPGLNPAATEAMEPGGPDIPSLSLTPSAGPGTEEEEPPLRPPAKNPGEQQLDPGWIQSLHYSLASRADYLQKHGHATPEQADLYRKLAPPLEEANARRTAFLLEHYANPLPAFHEMCRGNIRLMLACAPLYADVLEMRIRSMEDWTGASYLRPTGARKENLADAVAVLARDYVLGHIRKEDLELRHLAELCEHQYALMDGLMVFHMYPDAAPRDDKAVLSHFRQLQRSGVKKLERAVSNARREENRRRYEEQNPDRQARYRALREAELRRDGAFIEEDLDRELYEVYGAADVASSSPADADLAVSAKWLARETEDHGVGESLHGMELSFSPDDPDRDDDARGKDSLSADGEDGAPGPEEADWENHPGRQHAYSDFTLKFLSENRREIIARAREQGLSPYAVGMALADELETRKESWYKINGIADYIQDRQADLINSSRGEKSDLGIGNIRNKTAREISRVKGWNLTDKEVQDYILSAAGTVHLSALALAKVRDLMDPHLDPAALPDHIYHQHLVEGYREGPEIRLGRRFAPDRELEILTAPGSLESPEAMDIYAGKVLDHYAANEYLRTPSPSGLPFKKREAMLKEAIEKRRRVINQRGPMQTGVPEERSLIRHQQIKWILDGADKTKYTQEGLWKEWKTYKNRKVKRQD